MPGGSIPPCLHVPAHSSYYPILYYHGNKNLNSNFSTKLTNSLNRHRVKLNQVHPNYNSQLKKSGNRGIGKIFSISGTGVGSNTNSKDIYMIAGYYILYCLLQTTNSPTFKTGGRSRTLLIPICNNLYFMNKLLTIINLTKIGTFNTSSFSPLLPIH